MDNYGNVFDVSYRWSNSG